VCLCVCTLFYLISPSTRSPICVADPHAGNILFCLATKDTRGVLRNLHKFATYTTAVKAEGSDKEKGNKERGARAHVISGGDKVDENATCLVKTTSFAQENGIATKQGQKPGEVLGQGQVHAPIQVQEEVTLGSPGDLSHSSSSSSSADLIDDVGADDDEDTGNVGRVSSSDHQDKTTAVSASDAAATAKNVGFVSASSEDASASRKSSFSSSHHDIPATTTTAAPAAQREAYIYDATPAKGLALPLPPDSCDSLGSVSVSELSSGTPAPSATGTTNSGAMSTGRGKPPLAPLSVLHGPSATAAASLSLTPSSTAAVSATGGGKALFAGASPTGMLKRGSFGAGSVSGAGAAAAGTPMPYIFGAQGGGGGGGGASKTAGAGAASMGTRGPGSSIGGGSFRVGATGRGTSTGTGTGRNMAAASEAEEEWEDDDEFRGPEIIPGLLDFGMTVR
jgi:hypothetical protein